MFRIFIYFMDFYQNLNWNNFSDYLKYEDMGIKVYMIK